MQRTQTADDARTTLENVHTDRGSVVIGFSVAPVWILCPPEVTFFTLMPEGV